MSLRTIINDIAPVKVHNLYKGNQNLPQPYDPSVKKGTEPLTPEEEKVAQGMRLNAEEYREYRDSTEEETLSQEEVNAKLGEDVEDEYQDENYVPDLPDHFPAQKDTEEVAAFGEDPLLDEELDEVMEDEGIEL